MGIFAEKAGDFWRFPPEDLQTRSQETKSKARKARFPAPLRVTSGAWPNAGLAGWRRSTDRAGLQVDSLQTGNFTGKSSVFEVAETVSMPKTPVLQRLFEDFPRRINRENFSTNREPIRRIRE